jgi:hypothetical protein
VARLAVERVVGEVAGEPVVRLTAYDVLDVAESVTFAFCSSASGFEVDEHRTPAAGIAHGVFARTAVEHVPIRIRIRVPVDQRVVPGTAA